MRRSAAPDHLLAQELRAEGAHAEDVGDGVGVPAFGQHRDADHALDVLAELARLADGVHHLAQQVLVGQVRRHRGRGSAARYSALNSSISRGGDLLELGAHRLARLELLAVDQDGVRAVQPAAVAVIVAEERQAGPALDDRARRRSASPSRRCSRRPAWRRWCCCRPR